MNDLEVLLEPYALQPSAYARLVSLATSNVAMPVKSAPVNVGDNNRAIINVFGVMFRYENIFTKLGYGISTQTLKNEIKSALDDGKKVLLVIDSGGGTINGITDLCDFISANKESIHAFVKGVCASGALWLASSCGKITAEKTSMIGSLGVVTSVFDASKAYEAMGIFYKELVSSLSPNKRPNVLTEDGIAEERRQLDALAEIFISNVAKNRNVGKDEIVEKLERGGLITGVQALERGVIDAIDTLENLTKGESMPEEITEVAAIEPSVETKPDIEKGKFEALAMYRNLLSNEEFQSFMENKEATAEEVKNHILNKKAEAAKPISAVLVGEDNTKIAAKRDVEDAICLMGGIEVENASNRAKSMSYGRIKPLVASVAGLDYSATDSEFMAAMTTSDFPMLLRNATKRVLDAGFGRAATTYEHLINRVAHPDFREYNSVTRQKIPQEVWQPIVEGGEAKRFILTETGDSAKIESKAAAFNITRQMLVNDDLGAFTNMVSEFAESANLHINHCVYAFLEARGAYAGYKMKDGKPLFDNAHKNLLSGANSKLAEAGLKAARLAMMRQKDEFGNSIRVLPKILIVPPELLDVAQQLLVSPATLELNKNSGVKNIYEGAYAVVSDPEMENADAWYLATKGCVNFGYLAETGGRPVVELVDKSVIDGLSYQGVIDFTIYANRYQYITKNTGK